MTFRSFVRPLLVALSLAFATTAAAPAFAEGKDTKSADAKGHGKDKKRDKSKRGDKFPMTADKFSQVIEKHITRAKERLDSALTKHAVPDAKKAEIKKELDAGLVAVRDAVKAAGKDGTVTKDEAKTVRASVKSLKLKLEEKHLPKKSSGKDTPKDV